MGQAQYFIGVAPGPRADAYMAFVPDPLTRGRFVRTHCCVVFTACPSCGADLYVPCISATESTRYVFVRANQCWMPQEFHPHIARPCLTRRAKAREIRKTDRHIEARHRSNLEVARSLAKKTGR